MDLGAKNDQALISKLGLGRCDFAVEELEYVIGARRTLKSWPDESTLASFRPPWAKAPQLHFLISRSHPGAVALQVGINRFIASSQRNGFLKSLRKRYL